MPAPTYLATYSGNARSGASTTVSVPNAVVGDTLIAFQVGDYFGSTASMVAPSTATGVSSWSAVGSAVKGGEMYARAWRAQITAAGTRSVTMTRPSTSNAFNAVHVVHLRDVDPSQPIDATPTTGGGSSGSSFALPAITCETSDALLLGVWGGLTFSGSLTAITKPSTMTQSATASVRDGSQAIVMSAREQRTTAGSTGTRTATGSTSVNTGWVGLLVAVSGVRYIPVTPGGDGGQGDDLTQVDKTLVSSSADPGVASDPLRVDIAREPDTDAGIGSDTSYIDVLTPKWATDQGAGSDAVYRAVFKGNDLVETATGSDPITMARLRYVPVSDQGAGADVSSLRQDKAPQDNGVGSDSTASVRMPGLDDGGVGSEEIRILDIPFTQVLKRAGPPPVIYDLVVMARVPQAGGPPSFMEVDPIEWKSLQYTNELSAPQSLQATCQISSVPETILQRFRAPDELATEMWLLRNGVRVFAGPLVGLQTSGETLTINASGVAAYLKVMFVVSDYKKVADQHTVAKWLVDQWQALPYGNYGIDTSSIALSGTSADVEYKRDELHNVATKIDELGKADDGFDFEVDPVSRKLNLWHPGQGTNRSTGEDAIVFDGRNVTSSDVMVSVAVGDLASEAFGSASAGTDDKTWYSAQSNDALRARYGRAGVTSSFQDIKSQADLDRRTRALLNARASALAVPGPKVRVTPDADLGDYGIGDTVFYDLGSQLGVTGAYRIRKQVVSAASTGQESVDIEFV